MKYSRLGFGGLMFSYIYEFSKLERKIASMAGLYSGQPRVITLIKMNEGVTLSELSELSRIGMPSLSVSVRNMEKSGLLRREISGSDGRMQKIYLTDEGVKKADVFHEEIDSFYEKLLGKLGEDKAQQVADMLVWLTDEFRAYNSGKYGQ